MTQAELLRYVVDVLEALGVRYMIGGSQAAVYYGEPKAKMRHVKRSRHEVSSTSCTLDQD